MRCVWGGGGGLSKWCTGMGTLKRAKGNAQPTHGLVGYVHQLPVSWGKAAGIGLLEGHMICETVCGTPMCSDVGDGSVGQMRSSDGVRWVCGAALECGVRFFSAFLDLYFLGPPLLRCEMGHNSYNLFMYTCVAVCVLCYGDEEEVLVVGLFKAHFRSLFWWGGRGGGNFEGDIRTFCLVFVQGFLDFGVFIGSFWLGFFWVFFFSHF